MMNIVIIVIFSIHRRWDPKFDFLITVYLERGKGDATSLWGPNLFNFLLKLSSFLGGNFAVLQQKLHKVCLGNSSSITLWLIRWFCMCLWKDLPVSVTSTTSKKFIFGSQGGFFKIQDSLNVFRLSSVFFSISIALYPFYL